MPEKENRIALAKQMAKYFRQHSSTFIGGPCHSPCVGTTFCHDLCCSWVWADLLNSPDTLEYMISEYYSGQDE